MDIHPGEKYRHYKNRRTYTIIGIGNHSETGEKVVVYRGDYDDPTFGPRPIWVRPYEMFVENVEMNGTSTPRFTRIH